MGSQHLNIGRRITRIAEPRGHRFRCFRVIADGIRVVDLNQLLQNFAG